MSPLGRCAEIQRVLEEPAPAGQGARFNPPVDFSTVLDMAVKEARERGSTSVLPEHLLTALTSMQSGPAAVILRQANLTPARVRQLVGEITGGQAPEAPTFEALQAAIAARVRARHNRRGFGGMARVDLRAPGT